VAIPLRPNVKSPEPREQSEQRIRAFLGSAHVQLLVSTAGVTMPCLAAMPVGFSMISRELSQLILMTPPATIVSEYLLERLPHIFQDDWGLYRSWRLRLGSELQVDPCNLSVVGSSSSGFSLNPHKKLSPFGDHSDIDVAVISDYHFVVSWRTLRDIPLADARTTKERQALKEHRERLIFWGCIAADKVLRFLPFSKAWTIASSKMAAEPPTKGRQIELPIYKDYDALRSYHIDGVRRLRI
jgi:hypothetical protein